MLERLEERLRGIANYHISEWAQRLDDVGGPGVGGTELAYAPHFVQSAGTQDELVAMALETSIPATWEEAAWCYVFGRFRACIVMSAALLEIALKYELYRRGVRQARTLRPIIEECGKQGVIPEHIRLLAQSVNQRRNDVMHANIQMDRPDSLLAHTGDEHEMEPIEDLSRNITRDGWITGDGETIEMSFGKERTNYSRVLLFKRAARANLLETRKVLKHLYPLLSNQQIHEEGNRSQRRPPNPRMKPAA